ncbi:hypothetical protein GJQ57_16150 [Ralstonia pickettii]|uniref:Uncharacterized protein n=1 Tax=Ralstonia pickettii TaxID=329 RepID=A0A7X2LAL9_RALPI|nr:hypothetical protein [Ralstonia pickettii]MRT00174.1 hypothetical protein [Ralstonia pickettii]NWK44749.1 hypothetical protein [Ralstonia pickettii]
MSAIDPTSQLLAYIRTEAQNWRPEVARSGRAATPSPSANTPRGSEDLLTRVAQAVVAIDPDDPQRKKKAFRVYLGSVLANELGLHLLNDPGFDDLVGRVQASMEHDPKLSVAMERAGQLLLETARPATPRR